MGLLLLRHTSTLHSEPQKAGKFEQGLLGFLLQNFLLGEAAVTGALRSVALGAFPAPVLPPYRGKLSTELRNTPFYL